MIVLFSMDGEIQCSKLPDEMEVAVGCCPCTKWTLEEDENRKIGNVLDSFLRLQNASLTTTTTTTMVATTHRY